MYKRLTLTALVATSALAANLCDCGEWSASVDALYFKPVHCPVKVGFGERQSDEFEWRFQTLDIKGDYDWGVRPTLTYSNGCNYGSISYLWLETNDSFTAGNFSSGIEMPPFNQPDMDEVSSNLKLRYQNVDIRLGHIFCQGCNFALHMHGDIRWVDLCVRNHNFAFETGNGGSEAIWQQDSSFSGAGFGAGVGGYWNLLCNIDLSASLGIHGIIGDSKLDRYFSSNENVDEQFYEYVPNSRTCIVPALEFRTALSYRVDCACWDFGIELGYEMHYYIDAVQYAGALNVKPQQGGEDNDNGGTADPVCQSLGFAGPYIGVTVGF